MSKMIHKTTNAPSVGPMADVMVEALTEQIETGKLMPGDRLPAIRALAQQFNISFSTARGGIARLEQEGYVSTHQGSGTFVKRKPAAGDNKTVGSDWACMFVDQRAHVVGDLNTLLGRQLQLKGILPVELNWLPGRTRENFKQVMNMWGGKAPRTLIQQGHDEDIDQAIEQFISPHTIVITMFRTTQWMPAGWHSVNPDYTQAYTMAAKYLVEQGHKRVGLVAKPRMIRGFWRHTHRKAWMPQTQGIVAAGHVMRDAGLRSGLTIHYNVPTGNNPSAIPTDEPNVAALVDWLSKPNRPTAVMGADFRLLGVKRAARQLGLRIGEDLHLIGIGGSILEHESDYPIVSLQMQQLAQEAAALAASDPESLKGAARHMIVPPRLIDPTSGPQTEN